MIWPYFDLTTTIYKEGAKTHFLLYSQLIEANKSVPKANISYLKYEFFHLEMLSARKEHINKSHSRKLSQILMKKEGFLA